MIVTQRPCQARQYSRGKANVVKLTTQASDIN